MWGSDHLSIEPAGLFKLVKGIRDVEASVFQKEDQESYKWRTIKKTELKKIMNYDRQVLFMGPSIVGLEKFDTSTLNDYDFVARTNLYLESNNDRVRHYILK